jgi:chromosome segregation ATPase
VECVVERHTLITGSDEQKYKFFEDATELKVLGEKAYEAKKRERYESLRASVCKNISHMFNQVLALQQHHGHVNFDHTKKELKMNVELGEKRALVKGMKSLSGGERSTATLSLLMALLKCVNNPFTVLDEVFVAIGQSINVGVKMAELQESRQFIFITQQRLCCAAVQRTDTVNLINIGPSRSTCPACPRPSPKISSSTS